MPLFTAIYIYSNLFAILSILFVLKKKKKNCAAISFELCTLRFIPNNIYTHINYLRLMQQFNMISATFINRSKKKF